MMKTIVNIIFLAVFWIIPFATMYVIFRILNITTSYFIPALYLVFLFISITYKNFWSFQTFNKKRGIIKFLSVFFISFLILLYLNTLCYRSYRLYQYLVTENKRGWEGIAHQTDDTLGYKPVPNARAFHTFTVGDKIPMAFDGNGFRIPLSDTSKIIESNKTDLLFLGCSFTYGDACYAEETFPFLVAKKTNLSYINGGVCAYGLSQMLILAEKLIPKYKPNYVILQYSPWLVSRGTNIFAPVYFGSSPVPYFSERNNNYFLELPIYKSQIYNLSDKLIKSSYRGNFIKFLFKKGCFFYLYEDWAFLKINFLFITGHLLRPATNQKEVEKYAYSRIKTIAEKNGATVIILNLGDIEYSKNSHSLFSASNIYFAEADSFLNEFLKNSLSKDYIKEFEQWRFNGKDSIMVDDHPNFKAHSLIANSIIKEINKIKNK